MFDESLQLLRAVLENDTVEFHGRFFDVSAASVGTRPPVPLDIWLGGSAPAAFRRIGRLADGWLGSFLTAAEARAGRESIERAAAEAGRADRARPLRAQPAVADGGLPEAALAAVRQRRPDADPAELLAGDWPTLHRRIDGLVAAGLSSSSSGRSGIRPSTSSSTASSPNCCPGRTEQSPVGSHSGRLFAVRNVSGGGL